MPSSFVNFSRTIRARVSFPLRRRQPSAGYCHLVATTRSRSLWRFLGEKDQGRLGKQRLGPQEERGTKRQKEEARLSISVSTSVELLERVTEFVASSLIGICRQLTNFRCCTRNKHLLKLLQSLLIPEFTHTQRAAVAIHFVYSVAMNFRDLAFS
jgi:hypothetical protein